MDNVPEYYETLGVSPTATAAEIKDAYKKQSLLSHPDRFPNATPTERRQHTNRFQSVADAYYVLSDSTRRAEYDEARAARGSMPGASFFGASGDAEKEQSSSANFFRTFFGGSSASDAEGHGPTGQPQADNVFGSVFEELLRPEVHRVAPVWTWVGAASGAGLGFICGNIPGAIGGAVLGNRLGAIRDAKGKSVGQVFMNLGANQRAEVLKALMMKVLGSMGGGGGPGGSSGW